MDTTKRGSPMTNLLQFRNIRKDWRLVTVSTLLSWLMKLLMLSLAVVEIYQGNYLFAFAIGFAFMLSLVPSLVEHNYNITLPFELDLLITLSIFLHTFLGEGFDFYDRYHLWDKILHLYGGAVIGLLGFVVAYTFHYTKKIRLTIPLIGIFTVIFAIAVGAMWEIGEFTVDAWFAKNTQRGLDNTMWDLINDLIGGVVASGLGMLYVRYSKPMEEKRLAVPVTDVFNVGERIENFQERRRSKGRRRYDNADGEPGDRRR